MDFQLRGYQIIGTWSGRRPEAMECSEQTYSFTVTLGENRWESLGGSDGPKTGPKGRF